MVFFMLAAVHRPRAVCYQSSGHRKLEGLQGRTFGTRVVVYHEAAGFYLFSFAARKTVNPSIR
jgi:hypothetical protein